MMTRKRAPFTQAEIERALRAADRQGWQAVAFASPAGGSFRIDKTPEPVRSAPSNEWDSVLT
jgi:hypothetical protein